MLKVTFQNGKMIDWHGLYRAGATALAATTNQRRPSLMHDI